MRADQLLEGDDLLRGRVVRADDDHVAGVLEAGHVPQPLEGIRSVDRERVRPGDAAVVEVGGSGSADRREAFARSHHDDPDSRVVYQLLDQSGELFFDVLTRHAAPHRCEVDEREIARRAYHKLATSASVGARTGAPRLSASRLTRWWVRPARPSKRPPTIEARRGPRTWYRMRSKLSVYSAGCVAPSIGIPPPVSFAMRRTNVTPYRWRNVGPSACP